MEANQQKKAMVTHEKALEWQELFMLALQTNMPDNEIIDTAYRVAGECLAFKII
jgi:elongator complex protein 1